MALEAVVFQQDLFNTNTNNKDLSNLLGLSSWSHETIMFDYNNQIGLPLAEDHEYWFHDHDNQVLAPDPDPGTSPFHNANCDTTSSSRIKRRRARTRKNKEEIENQRMTHIAVERNRRRKMNEYLSVLRSLMPDSYVQRGDQASIIGGAINYVKELEQLLQSLGSQKEIKKIPETSNSSLTPSLPFSEFFTFPQYFSSLGPNYSVAVRNEALMDHDHGQEQGDQQSIADIEVTMVETHANLKIRSEKRPKQLVKIVSGLHSLRLTVLHLNVTTAHQIVLYSLSVKVEDDSELSSVDEIAKAVYEMLCKIHEEYGN